LAGGTGDGRFPFAIPFALPDMPYIRITHHRTRKGK
jgi:hypothetical protein